MSDHRRVISGPQARDAHYTIAVFRVQDGVNFRSNSVLYSQNDIKSQQMIPHSTVKFWTQFHEVGHLIGLGHVGTGGKTNVHNDNSPTGYGGTKQEMQDVMGRVIPVTTGTRRLGNKPPKLLQA